MKNNTTNMIEIQFKDSNIEYLRKSVFFMLKCISLTDLDIMRLYIKSYCYGFKTLTDKHFVTGCNKTLYKIERNISNPVISEENGNDYYGYEVSYLD